MSGAQPKAGNIAGCVTVCAEVNKKAIDTRHSQGWVDEVFDDLTELTKKVRSALEEKRAISIAFHGNIVALWEHFEKEQIKVDLGSDQTSLHNPWAGGYYPVSLTFEQANEMMANHPDEFKIHVQKKSCAPC
jgi:urocanate hydratase